MFYSLIRNELEHLISVCKTDALSISTSGQQPLFVVSRPRDAAGSSVCVRVCFCFALGDIIRVDGSWPQPSFLV